MAYIPMTNKKLMKSVFNVYTFSVPEGGMKCNDTAGSDDGKCRYLCNMDIENGNLSTRKVQTRISDNTSFDGTLYSVTKKPFCGKTVMHIGTGLYSYDSIDNSFGEISDTLPDEKSLFCAFMSKLYIYCAGHIFSLDEEFVLKEEHADAPLLFDTQNAGTPSKSSRLDVPLNILAPRIAVRYTSGLTPVINGSGYWIELPYKLDTSREAVVIADGEELDAKYFRSEESFVVVSSDILLKDCEEVVVKYYVKNPTDIGFEYDIGKCGIAEAFGGNTMGGTRIFFFGGDEKGRYYKSELQNPLCVLSDSEEIIGDGCENVTAVIKMYSSLIIFTAASVYRMSYSLMSDGGVYSIKQIGEGIGCDCPQSVQLIDNRAVFANSEKGIFIVDPDGDTDEHNIKPVSGNINGNLLSGDKECLKAAQSIDFDRKYMLFVSDKAYIWNYDQSTFSDYGNYKKSQDRLVWYMYDGLVPGMYFDCGGTLVCLDTEKVCFYALVEGKAYGITGTMRHGNTDFGYPMHKKFVNGMEFDVKTDGETEFTVTVYADGIKAFESTFSADTRGSLRPKIRLPKKKMYNFDFEISANGNFEIGNIYTQYSVLKK